MRTLVKPRALFTGLSALCLLSIWLSLALGPVSLPLFDTLRAALRLIGVPIAGEGLEQAELILGQIRLPRTLLGLAVGGVLALSGVAMQGLFRNPLADPGLVGVSSGAALGAAIAIVGGAAFGGLPEVMGPYLLSLCAFIGGLGVTALVYRLGRRNGQTNVAVMLLAGIALTALAGSAVGLFTYLADDATLRTLTFWNLGSLNGASYARLWPLLIVTAGVALWLPRRAKALNALLLGESEASHLGIDVEGLKRELVFCTALGVGAAVAAAGMIGFIGLVVPHLVRLLAGPDHRVLLPASVLAGATLRTLTFWNLGSLNGASYARLWPLLIVTVGVALWLPRRANALNALLLGESEANHLGIDVEGLKRELVFCTALGVGAAVAAAGMIGFIGLVVPHLVRLLAGPDHRVLLPASVLAGATLLLFADLIARLALAPAELPIGIVTAFLGAPFFLYLLMRGRH